MTEEEVKKLIKYEISNYLDIDVQKNLGAVVVSVYYKSELIARDSVQIEKP